MNFGFACLLFIVLVEQLPGTDARWPWQRKKDNRTFKKGTGSDVKIEAGDTVITSLYPNSMTVTPPFRWFYAVNDHQVIHFLPKWRHIFSVVKPVLVDVPFKYPQTKIENRHKKTGHIGPVGTLIAALMLEHPHEFPFNIFFCNCKHYTEYLSLGMVKGHYHHPLYSSMSKSCPLVADLDAGMMRTIHKSMEFTLRNKKGRTWHLKVGAWPSYVPQSLFTP